MAYDGPNSGGSVFDSSGFKPTQITDPRGVVTTLTYDAMYRTTAQTVSAGGSPATTSTQYDPAGRPTRVTDPLGRVTLTVYDVFGQIQRVTHPDGTQVSTDYTHHGKPYKVIDEAGNLTKTEFDAAGRAVKAEVKAAPSRGLGPNLTCLPPCLRLKRRRIPFCKKKSGMYARICVTKR